MSNEYEFVKFHLVSLSVILLIGYQLSRILHVSFHISSKELLMKVYSFLRKTEKSVLRYSCYCDKKRKNLHDSADIKCQWKLVTSYLRLINLLSSSCRQADTPRVSYLQINPVEIYKNKSTTLPLDVKNRQRIKHKTLRQCMREEFQSCILCEIIIFRLNFPLVFFSSNTKYFFSSAQEAKKRKEEKLHSSNIQQKNWERKTTTSESVEWDHFPCAGNSWEVFSSWLWKWS